MSARMLALALCVLVVHAPLRAAADAPAPGAREVSAEARARFQRGVDLYRAGDLGAALAEFERARELRDSPLLSYYIGRVAFELRKYAHSYRAFARFLAAPVEPGSADERAAAEATLSQVRLRVAFLTITTNVPGAGITIDDEPYGQAPLLEPVVLNAGTHRIRASKAQYVASAKAVTVGGGDHLTVHLDLEPLEAPGTTQREPERLPPTVAASERKRLGRVRAAMTPLSWSGVAGAASLLVVGTVTGALALKASADLADTRFMGASARSDFEGQSNRVHRLSVASDVFLAAGVVTAGATLGLVFYRARHPQPRAPVRARVGLAPMGLAVWGDFGRD